MIDYDQCLVQNHFCPSCFIHVTQIVYLAVVGILCPKINLLFINSYEVHIPSYPKISTVSTHPQLVVSPSIGSPHALNSCGARAVSINFGRCSFGQCAAEYFELCFSRSFEHFGFKKIHKIFQIYYSPTHIHLNMVRKRNTEWTSYAMIVVSFYMFSA